LDYLETRLTCTAIVVPVPQQWCLYRNSGACTATVVPVPQQWCLYRNSGERDTLKVSPWFLWYERFSGQLADLSRQGVHAVIRGASVNVYASLGGAQEHLPDVAGFKTTDGVASQLEACYFLKRDVDHDPQEEKGPRQGDCLGCPAKDDSLVA